MWKDSKVIEKWKNNGILGIKESFSMTTEKDSRSMASLIEKLIKDHLQKEEISWEEEGGE